MKILAAAPCYKTPVIAGFYDCFYGLKLTEGSIFRRVEGMTVPGGLNKLVNEAQEGKFDYLFIVEDDSLFPEDTVLRLLAHDKDVVSGLCLSRQPPFRPYIYNGFEPGKGLKIRFIKSSERGLIKVATTGMGGILIKMSIFNKIPKPYFNSWIEIDREWTQDIVFGKKLIEAGIEVFCDLDVKIWHNTMCALCAEINPLTNKWEIAVVINNFKITFPLMVEEDIPKLREAGMLVDA